MIAANAARKILHTDDGGAFFQFAVVLRVGHESRKVFHGLAIPPASSGRNDVLYGGCIRWASTLPVFVGAEMESLRFPRACRGRLGRDHCVVRC